MMARDDRSTNEFIDFFPAMANPPRRGVLGNLHLNLMFLGLAEVMVCVALFVLSVFGRSSIAQESDGTLVPPSISDLPSTRFWLSGTEEAVQDTWETPASELITAIILEIDERNIVCITKDKPTTPSRLDALRLHAIEITWTNEKAQLAHAAFTRGDHVAAIENAKKAIAEGKVPRWQQKILASEITDSLRSLGQTPNACRVFISLCKESPAPMLYASAPLNWDSQRANSTLSQQAEDWMRSDRSLVEQLIGASWLLSGNKAAEAQATLEQLQRSKSPVIAQLASAQLWRLELPNQVSARYREWSEYRDRLLLPLQVGPTITIADKLQRAGLKEQALQEWLRIIAIHSERRKEMLQARDAATGLLKELGRSEEANRLIEKVK